MLKPAKYFPVARWRRAPQFVIAALCALHLVSSRDSVTAAEPAGKARASELVSQLGHEEFAMRERAAAELIPLELDAVPALRLGTKSSSREIRHRSTKLLAVIAQIDLERRFEQFKNDTDPEQDYGLPAWDDYRAVVGDSLATRSVFVSMHEDESRLLGQLQDDPKHIGEALADRCDQLRGQAVFGVQVRLGTTATLLFLSTRDGIDASPLVQSVVYMACASSNFDAALESETLRDVLVTLTERWISRHPARDVNFALNFGLSHELKGCLPRAREVFESPVATVSDRVYACLCVAKFGDESDYARLETYLDDVTICAQDQFEGQVVVTQMRDIALASLVRLAQQEPKDFGFDRIEFHSKMVFNLSSLAFRDEQSRAQAIAAWRAYRRSTAEAKAAQ